MSQLFPIHVRTITGLEEVLKEELAALGALDLQSKNRLVTCRGDQTLLYKANLWCRTAIRVLRPLVSFPASDEKAFYRGIQKIDWSRWMSPSGTLAIDSNVHSSFSTHSLYMAQLAKDAIVDQFRDRAGHRPSVDLENPDLRIAVNLYQDTAQIFLDASGESLHKRGYRRKTGEAPLNETLAAGILKLSGWDGGTSLMDPMCGSGTFCIEAALILKNMAPGLIRKHFGFQRWPDYDRGLYDRLVEEAKSAIRYDRKISILGVDSDPIVLEGARENLARAGLEGWVRFEKGDFFEWSDIPQPVGTLVMNPPYNERIEVEDVAEFYQRIGDRFKKAYGGWMAYVLAGNLEAAKFIGLKTSRRIVLFNGPIECRLLKFEIRAASQSTTVPGWRTQIQENPKWKEKAEVFSNRLKKNFKHGNKTATEAGSGLWRVYDWDIPELPFYVDLQGDQLHFFEVERNLNRNLIEHRHYINLMMRTAAEVLNIAPEKISFKKVKAPQ